MDANERELLRLLESVTEPDEAAREAAARQWASCAKPLGSLGLLEEAVERIAALTGNSPVSLSPRAVLVLCADKSDRSHVVL